MFNPLEFEDWYYRYLNIPFWEKSWEWYIWKLNKFIEIIKNIKIMNLLKKILGHTENTKDNPSNLPVVKHNFKKLKKEDLKSEEHPFSNYVVPTPVPGKVSNSSVTSKNKNYTEDEKKLLEKLGSVKSSYTKEAMIKLINNQKYDSKGRLEGTTVSKSRIKELVEIIYS